MAKKRKMIETLILPEAMIQHIQSFMSEKEAVRSSILSKSWYDAWLTRPEITIDDVGNSAPEEFTKKRMQRYQDLNVKIESFRLRARSRDYDSNLFSRELLVEAMKIGATNVELEFPTLTLPPQVLGSETLLRLSMTSGYVDASASISCWRLKSLALKEVSLVSCDPFKDIISCCLSMEELSLSKCHGLTLSFKNELRKLRRLFLEKVDVDSMFFTDFGSRFPCLKDLTILDCSGYSRIKIASTSLETIEFTSWNESEYAAFEVPNILRFTFKGCIGRLLSIEGALREWELDLSLAVVYDVGESAASWFRNLKDLLAKFRLSRISLYIVLVSNFEQDEVGVAAVPEPIVLENLRICGLYPSSAGCAMFRLFEICRPKFIMQYRATDQRSFENTSFEAVYKRLMQQVIAPNHGIPDQDMFGKVGLKRVNMEVYETFDDKVWCPLALKTPLDVTNAPETKQKVRFELVWDC